MTDNEREANLRVNVDKAKNKTVASISLVIASIGTYIIPMIYGGFDFGIVFEVVSLLFLLIARNYMKKYNESKAKTFVICSMVAVGWLVIYDIMCIISNIEIIIDWSWISITGEVITILYLIKLFEINRDLSKAENPIKFKESSDWFYETQSEDEKKR